MSNHTLQPQPKESARQANSAPKPARVEKSKFIDASSLRFSALAGAPRPSVQPKPQGLPYLQRTIGNRAVGRLIQAQLTVSQPGDKFEQEADGMADSVMRMPEPPAVRPGEEEEKIQRKCAACESGGGRCPNCAEEKDIQRSSLSSATMPFIQRQGEKTAEGKTFSAAPPPSINLASQLKASKGKGSSLPKDTRSSMESAFGTNFSQVRVHNSETAVQMSRDLNALAFTHGTDVYFNKAQYNPGTFSGKRLLAHELTHVVQQTGAVQSQRIMRERMHGSEKFASNNTAARDLLPPTPQTGSNRAIFRQEIDAFRGTHSADSQSRGKMEALTYSSVLGKGNQTPNIQRANKLENDLGAATGVTCPISTEQLSHPDASLDITFNLNATGLSATDINNIAVFVNNWHNASLSVPVRIHGYASKDGPPTLNWPLSCRRAEAVSKQMQKIQKAAEVSTEQKFPEGTPGIPAGFVQVFAHGETEEFSKTALPPNRRATVHVPTLPSLPGKVAKTPTAKLKSGPTYTPNGTIAAKNTKVKKEANFKMSAEFEENPKSGILASCGQIRQYIKWSNANVDPERFHHDGFLPGKSFLPNTWYEDRDQVNTRYGHRSGPHSALDDDFDQYFDKAKKVSPNPASGRFYEGNDTPEVRGSAAFISSWVGTWEFRIDAIDTCNGNKVLGSDTVKINW